MAGNQIAPAIGCKAQSWFEFRQWISQVRGPQWRMHTTDEERRDLWFAFLLGLEKEGRITERQRISWMRTPGR